MAERDQDVLDGGFEPVTWSGGAGGRVPGGPVGSARPRGLGAHGGEIRTRSGLDRRTRSAVTLTALIAAGHWEEFEMHVHAAPGIGRTREEIPEVLLQAAIHLSVPSAANASEHARQVPDALDAEDAAPPRPELSFRHPATDAHRCT